MIAKNFVPTIGNVLNGYKSGQFTPAQLIAFLQQRADEYLDRNIWISRADPALIDKLVQQLQQSDPVDLPLYGVPFAAKDNIDVAGFDTTAGCPEYRYTPEASATITARLIAAGAIPLGKTNLDQFATGLVGTRSPHGPCKNAFDPDYISGGSSSGSAVATALGLVSFALGTDTAGSGRVPAMLNNLIGLKPSRGLFSMTGVVPACRSLDCPSVFAFNSDDAALVFNTATSHDHDDCYSRANPFSNSIRAYGNEPAAPVIGIPQADQLNFFDSADSETLFKQAVQQWRELGASIVEADFAPLLDAARLLYEGPWVAERYAAIEALIDSNPDVIHPVVRGIIEGARGKTAVDTFNAEYRMQRYRAYAAGLFNKVDFLLTPTAPRHYLIEELLNDPVRLNANTGYYTNFMNLLDLCGIAVPTGFMSNGLPFGTTLTAPAFHDVKLLNYAKQWQSAVKLPYGALPEYGNAITATVATVVNDKRVSIAVCGAHLSGCALNWQLTERGGTLLQTTTTSASYRMYCLAKPAPPRPGLIRDISNGVQIDVEIWSLPSDEVGSFINNIPYPLGIGKVELADGSWVSGFVCDPVATPGMQDISQYGSWKSFQAQQA